MGIAALLNPYAETNGLSTYKGDLHFHSDRSDGRGRPDEMYARFAACGFHFCGLADHDAPTTEPSRHDGLLVLPSQEMSADTGHIVGIAAPGIRDKSWSTAEQLHAIHETGGLAILSHPRIREFVEEQGLTYTAHRLLNELAGQYDALEIYTHNVGSGMKLAIDRLDVVWNSMVLPCGKLHAEPFRPVWGMASSDAHDRAHVSENVGIIVWATTCTPSALMDAIAKGRFYSLADTQARLPSIAVEGEMLVVEATETIMLRVVQAQEGCAALISRDAAGRLMIRYPIAGDEGFLRIEAMDAEGRCAYSNPIFIGKRDA